MIPADKQPLVQKALQKTFGVDEFETMEQLTKGLSGALVFKITVHGTPYLLRVITRTETRDKPAYYFDCLKTAADAGIAPRIHYLDIDDRISITDFIQPKHFSIADARIQMADLIKDLHALPKFAHQMSFLEASDNFLQRFRASNIVPESETKDVFDLYEKIRKVYPRYDEANLVSCHNDIKADNIIFDGMRPWLVDWEAARLNDRYLDLAAIANFVVKNESDENELLQRYFGDSLDEYNQARFFLMSMIVHMFCFTLCTMLYAAGKSIDINTPTVGFNEFHDGLWNCQIDLADNDQKLHYGLVHYHELVHKMKTDRFGETLRTLSNYSTMS